MQLLINTGGKGTRLYPLTIDLPKPINVSNVQLLCPSCKKVTRVGFKVEGAKKLRICRKCGKEIGGKSKA